MISLMNWIFMNSSIWIHCRIYMVFRSSSIQSTQTLKALQFQAVSPCAASQDQWVEEILKPKSFNHQSTNKFDKSSNCFWRATRGQLLSFAVSSCHFWALIARPRLWTSQTWVILSWARLKSALLDTTSGEADENEDSASEYSFGSLAGCWEGDSVVSTWF